jgi:hypothetical protein
LAIYKYDKKEKSSEGKSQNSAVQNLRIKDEKKKTVQPLALVPTVSRLKKKTVRYIIHCLHNSKKKIYLSGIIFLKRKFNEPPEKKEKERKKKENAMFL